MHTWPLIRSVSLYYQLRSVTVKAETTCLVYVLERRYLLYLAYEGTLERMRYNVDHSDRNPQVKYRFVEVSVPFLTLLNALCLCPSPYFFSVPLLSVSPSHYHTRCSLSFDFVTYLSIYPSICPARALPFSFSSLHSF